MGRLTVFTETMAEEVLKSTPTDNQAALREAKRGILDFLASAFAGREDAGIAKLLHAIEEEGGNPITPLIAQGKMANRRQAALVNGFMGHALDYDDVHSDVRGHPSSVILPVLFALASGREISGKSFLDAYIIGVEVMARLGQAIGTGSYLKGWHNTSLLGGVAATFAGARLLGFTVAQMRNAVGIAVSQASGLRVQFGTEMKPLHAGLAAQQAVQSIEWTQQDFHGTEMALDSAIGFLHVYAGKEADEAVRAALTEGWGKSWRIAEPGLWFKRNPFCSAASHGADAALALAQLNLDAEAIEKIDIVFPPGGDAALIHKRPKTGEQGRFSIEYVVALALLGQPFTLGNFGSAAVSADAEKLMRKMFRSNDADHKPDPQAIPKGRFTIVRIALADGSVHSREVCVPKGSPQAPLSDAELESKWRESAPDLEVAERILQAIRGLENSSLRELEELL
ncbi:MmgE/PrpD family protein [Trichococcus pasteurii]|uniref:Mmge/prpd n=1 Tax=Trichococcus pasteurii TaxID=43064 RepID=A0A1W1IH60_9LACT|nr:MmgE/PrpD family protein [Trichococcus pasteurii]SFE54419.1 2-methylcitrate dehydratase PrpD [Trichococcus pasteurii]SLM52362.1 mmge/prpd [Trichococcus pasteurii]SSB93243.1 mmge/prpd [Trichococcus pasteurii]